MTEIRLYVGQVVSEEDVMIINQTIHNLEREIEDLEQEILQRDLEGVK